MVAHIAQTLAMEPSGLCGTVKSHATSKFNYYGTYLVKVVHCVVLIPACGAYLPWCCRQVCATKKVCRYHPTEVKQGMAALAQAQEHLQSACGAAWTQLLQDFTAAHHAAFRQAVAAVAQLDALHALAVVAMSPGYCRPQVGRCEIGGCCHTPWRES